MNAFEVYLKTKRTGLTLPELAVIDVVKANPGLNSAAIADKMGISRQGIIPKLKVVVAREELQVKEISSPRKQKLYY